MKPADHACAAFARYGRGARVFVFQHLSLSCFIAIVWSGFCLSRLVAEEPAKLVAIADRRSFASIASRDEISHWIDELGHNDFTVRQAAASRLLSAGMPAREP